MFLTEEELLALLILLGALCAFTLNGLLEIYGQFLLHFLKLQEFACDEIRDLVKTCKNLQESSKTNLTEITAQANKLASKHRIKFELQGKEAVSKIVYLLEEIKNSDIKPFQVDRLDTVLGGTANLKKVITEIAKRAELRLCCSAGEFYCYVEYLCAYVIDELYKLKLGYKRELRAAESNPSFRRRVFEREPGIVGGKRKFFK